MKMSQVVYNKWGYLSVVLMCFCNSSFLLHSNKFTCNTCKWKLKLSSPQLQCQEWILSVGLYTMKYAL